ncbi:MAG: phosphoribosylamine--glycine ligase [Chloroflexota bacterium]|nr:phosphoribosylamine--glycine ligase [Chloroflexota bacterium]
MPGPRVLVVGSGGREHALAWRLAREGVVARVAPGNGGTPNALPLDALDCAALADFAERERLDLTIVGPEAPLAAGIVDYFTQRGLQVLGPTRAAARLEWSKAFAKDFLARHSIPTAAAQVVGSQAEASAAAARRGLPVVLKADGLAGGKGVFVTRTRAELERALDQLFGQRTLGAAADAVLVEECLDGPELSVLAFCDGQRVALMPPVRDYKRLLDYDRGPNTGGMGGMARPSYATPELLWDIEQRVLRPTIEGMLASGQPYRGILYAGLILTRDGPRVLEFNCRFGDPEAELILPLLEGSLFEACAATAAGALEPTAIGWRMTSTYGVVLAAAGYPEAPRVGEPIAGLEALPARVHAFHAGTRLEAARGLVTSGGRVMCLVGEDRAAVYQAAEAVTFSGKQFRRDIGLELASAVGANA